MEVMSIACVPVPCSEMHRGLKSPVVSTVQLVALFPALEMKQIHSLSLWVRLLWKEQTHLLICPANWNMSPSGKCSGISTALACKNIKLRCF